MFSTQDHTVGDSGSVNEPRLSGSVVDRLYWLIADEGMVSANVKGVRLATMGELYVQAAQFRVPQKRSGCLMLTASPPSL